MQYLISTSLILTTISMLAMANVPATQEAPKNLSPRDVVIREITAARAGDIPAVRAMLCAESEEETAVLEAMAELLVAQSRFETAMRNTYGAAAIKKFGVNGEGDLLETARTAPETTVGDEAEVAIKAMPPVKLRRLAGVWKIVAGSLVIKVAPPGVERLGGRYSRMAELLDQATAGIKTGKFASAEAASKETEKQIDETARGVNAQ